MKLFRFLFLACLLLCGVATAQTLRPDQMMVLVVGRSAESPDADEEAVVDRLQGLRQDPAWRRLQMGTMHFDRPREAEFARNVLGIQRADLPCLVLAQLNEKRVPARKLYAIPRVTRASLDQVDKIAQSWAVRSGVSVPGNNGATAPGGTAAPEPGLSSLPFRIANGHSLGRQGGLRSPNNQYALSLQEDGNLVLYRTNTRPYTAIWDSQTSGSGATEVRLGPDGILRLLTADGNLVWQSHSDGVYGRYYFQLQTDGNAVIYRIDSSGTHAIWNTATFAQ